MNNTVILIQFHIDQEYDEVKTHKFLKKGIHINVDTLNSLLQAYAHSFVKSHAMHMVEK